MHHQGLSFGQGAQAGYVQMLLTDDDPQMDLPVPAQALAGSGPWQLEVDCGWPQSADYLALLGRQAPLPAQEAPVEIVLPVYGGLDVLGRCLSSLFAAKCRTPWHLTLINDASPQPEVGPWLRELALKHPEVTVLTNARNLGFVGTVNLGMRLAGRRDVVLLNSDTEVANDWLDRLHRAAWAEPRAGTVTPFSNNATICSHPRFCEDNPMPSGHTTASLDRLFARPTRAARWASRPAWAFACTSAAAAWTKWVTSTPRPSAPATARRTTSACGPAHKAGNICTHWTCLSFTLAPPASAKAATNCSARRWQPSGGCIPTTKPWCSALSNRIPRDPIEKPC
jgi:hypothetical protein